MRRAHSSSGYVTENTLDLVSGVRCDTGRHGPMSGSFTVVYVPSLSSYVRSQATIMSGSLGQTSRPSLTLLPGSSYLTCLLMLG